MPAFLRWSSAAPAVVQCRGVDKASRKWGFRADFKRWCQRCHRWGNGPGQGGAVLGYAVRLMAWCREAIRPHRSHRSGEVRTTP
jgi:hypothetical protein